MKEKLKKLKISLMTFLFTLSTKIALADDPYGITSTSKDTMATKVKGAVDNVFYVVGGVAIFIGFILIGLQLIFSNKNPEKRTAAMSGLFYAGLGTAIVGAAAVIGGFFFKLAQ